MKNKKLTPEEIKKQPLNEPTWQERLIVEIKKEDGTPTGKYLAAMGNVMISRGYFENKDEARKWIKRNILEVAVLMINGTDQ